ncbi:MAG: hypothetical protein AAF533_29720, partial [Acidobacteriota bacterium]
HEREESNHVFLGLVLASPGRADGAVHFVAHDVVLASGSQTLAAWQVEVVLDASTLIVGVEGGEAGAFRDPAAHDPAALQGGRIVLAAFSTSDDVRSGSQRVATLHVQESGSTTSPPVIRVVAAASTDGRSLQPTARLLPRDTP